VSVREEKILSERVEEKIIVRTCRGEKNCPSVRVEEKENQAREREKVFQSELKNKVHEVGGYYNRNGGTPSWIRGLVAHEYPDREELQRRIRQTGSSYIGL